MKSPSSLAHFLPKYVTFLIAIQYLPYQRDLLIPFLLSLVAGCLFLHSITPNQAVPQPPVLWRDHSVIVANLCLTVLWITLFVRVASDHLIEVDSLASVPWYQFLYPIAWILSDELLFFCIHRFAHRPGVYEHCHKMHHKFKVTNAWTSFYSHPADHSVSVVGAGLALPLLMTAGLGIDVAVPIIAFFVGGAIVTFIASHHAIQSGDSSAVLGTDHLIHHQKFTVNYGNFGYIDRVCGTHRTAANAVKGWLKIPGVGTIL